MTAAAARGPDRAEAARWAACAALILGLHAGAVAALMATRVTVAEPGEALPAVMVDLAPPPSAPVQAPSMTPPSERVPDLATPEPVAEAPPDMPPPDMPPPDMPAPEVTPPRPMTADAPSPVPRETAAVALPPPLPKAAPRAKPVETVVERKPPKPVPAKRGERQDRVRPPAEEAGASTTAALASASSGSSAASRASWQGALVQHLRRSLQPQGSQTGVASVRFTISRSGQVLSTALAGSAGSAALDAEAVAVFRRAQPLPAAPADVPGSTFTFTIPVRFTTR